MSLSSRYGRATRDPTLFFFSSRRRHTRCSRDWSSDVCSSDLTVNLILHCLVGQVHHPANARGQAIYHLLLEIWIRSEEHTSELQSRLHLVCRLLLEKKNKQHAHVWQQDAPGSPDAPTVIRLP